jgi:hypothetical protein
MSKKIYLALLVFPLSLALPCGAIAADEKPAKPAELKALEALAGSWDTQATFKGGEGAKDEVRVTGSVKCEWILDGRVLQGKGSDSLPTEFLGQWTYDTNKKAYRSWFFNSNGNVVEWAGKWDADAKSFLFKQDLGDGVTDNFTIHIADANTIEFSSEAKGKDGKLHFAMEGKWKRKK